MKDNALIESPTQRPAAANRARLRRINQDDSTASVRPWVSILLVLGLAATSLPFVWMFLGSFKTQGELLRDPLGWWPQHPTLGNYSTWLTQLGFGGFFVNSVIVASLTVLGNLVFCSMVAYALAKMDFAGKRLLFACVLGMLMVPGTVTFVPLFVQVAKMGLLNTYPALILPFLTAPIGVFLMRQFLIDIPDSLIEAARLDGAGELRIFARVVIPLCGAPLATLGILTFLSSWNNFLWPLVAAQTAKAYTLPVALTLFTTGQYGTQYGLLLAGAVMVIAPILVLFVLLQRFFTQGIAGVGIK